MNKIIDYSGLLWEQTSFGSVYFKIKLFCRRRWWWQWNKSKVENEDCDNNANHSL